MGGKGGGGAQATNEQLVQMQMQQAAQAAESNKELQARLQQGKTEISQMFEGRPGGSQKLDLSSLLPGGTPYTPPGTAAAGAGAGAGAGIIVPGSANDPNRGISPYIQPQGRSPIMPNPAWTNVNYGGAGGGAAAPSSAATAGAVYNYGGAGGSFAGNTATSGYLPSGYSWQTMPDNGGATAYGIYDPSGNLVTTANSLSDLAKSNIYVGGDPSQTTGGFGSDFYDKYRNAITGYYLPQEDQQYQNARSSLNYGLARAGQLRSGTAGMDVANLANQDVLAQANIQSQADNATGQLRTQIAQDEQSALNQLYSTEDPTVAANTAGNMVANADLQKPMLNPMGNVINTISVGVGNALSGFTNPYAYINPGAGGMGPSTTQGTGATGSGAGGGSSTITG